MQGAERGLAAPTHLFGAPDRGLLAGRSLRRKTQSSRALSSALAQRGHTVLHGQHGVPLAPQGQLQPLLGSGGELIRAPR
jgi:hypothetical protein